MPFVKRPTNAEGSSGFFINTFQISTPTCFGIWLPSSGGRECPLSYSSNVLCYGRVRIMTRPLWPVARHSRPTEDGNHMLKHVGVEILNVLIKKSTT
jgi:hypothetical protein